MDNDDYNDGDRHGFHCLLLLESAEDAIETVDQGSSGLKTNRKKGM
jgi:hypothetical protein